MSTTSKTRHTAAHPCPVCGGHDQARRGQGERCHGFTNGEWAHCSREEFSGECEHYPKSQTWSHRLGGPCRCGVEHAPADPASSRQARREIIATYDYQDREGNLVFQVVRFAPKTFRQRRPDPSAKDGWAWNLSGVEPVLYRLPSLLDADPAETIFIVEGERDADRLVKFEQVATCNPMGAGKWRDAYAQFFRGRSVVILPDHDQPGRDHAQTVAQSLHGVAAEVRILELPGLPAKGDVSDWLNHGGTIGRLKELATEAPPWIPQTAHSNGKAASEGGFVGFVGASTQESPKFEGEPRSLTPDLLPVPILDPRMIPAPLRDWLCDIAERGCFPLEYPTAAAIVGLSGLVGRKIAIRPKREDDWLVVPNLWGAVVGPPGVQKTPAVEEALRPLNRLAVEALKAHDEKMERFHDEVLVAAAKAKAAKSDLEKAAKNKRPEEELLRLAGEASVEKDCDEPTAKRYMVNDATVEKLGELLSENPNGLTQFRDELTGFFRTMDRQGRESDRGFYLESWNGLGSYIYDRIGRGTLVIPNVCLAIFGTIQPGPMARYLRGAASGEEADGFMPRFQVLVYPDPPAEFVNIDRYPDQEAKAEAWKVFQALNQFDAVKRDCQVDEDRNIPYIRFAPDAQKVFDEWRTDMENRLRSGELNTLMQCHLAKYRSLMPALALLFHLIDHADTPRLPLVSLHATQMATAWCDFLEAHAKRVYQSAMDGDPDAAQQLAERIKQSLPNPFAFRQVAQKGWSGLSNVEDVRRAIGLLEDRGWVKVVEAPPGPQGGRPSEQVWIHPKLQNPVEEGGTSP